MSAIRSHLLGDYRAASERLAGYHEELGQLNQAIITLRAATFQTALSQGLAVTAAREAADAAVAHHRGDAAALQGMIDSELATLRYLDAYLAYSPEVAAKE